MNEGMIVGVLFLLLVLFKLWKNRKWIKESYINGYNMICSKAGMPPYIPKEKKNE